jgi:hypothetical protein
MNCDNLAREFTEDRHVHTGVLTRAGKPRDVTPSDCQKHILKHG